tara:strand:+ start:136 stop:1107 length:972 start_codon:yes stop_codon:yes gene_type:complete
MKVQFDHLVQSSFYLWVDDQLTVQAEAITSGVSQIFTYSDLATDVPSNLVAYYAPDRQLMANGTGAARPPYGQNAPSGVYIDTVFTNQFTDNLLIDFDQGRVLLDATRGTDLTISGKFDRKNVNVYVTNDSEQDLLNRDFILASDGDTWLQQRGDLGEYNYTVPAVFISCNGSRNLPFALGGEDQTRTDMRVVCIAEDNYTLDGLLSLFRDTEKTSFTLFDYNAFPFGEYFHIKEPPYTYSGLVATYPSNKKGFIDSVVTSKLYDRSSLKIHKGLLIGFADFQLEAIRFPRLGPIVKPRENIITFGDEEEMVTFGDEENIVAF